MITDSGRRHKSVLKKGINRYLKEGAESRLKTVPTKDIKKEEEMLMIEGRLEKGVVSRANEEKTEEKIRSFETKLFAVLRRYLSCSLYPDVGPITAKRIVLYFGARTAQVIETSPRDLLAVEGVGIKRMTSVHVGWMLQQHLKEDLAKLMQMESEE